jgi:protein-disulfide isomerase
MIRTIPALLAAFALALPLSLSTAAYADETALTRSDVESIVREYLLANPEILEEAFTALQQKREAEADAARLEQLAVYRDELENSPRDPVLGNPEGDVTLVEFFDYNCGYCRRAHDDMKRLIEGDPELRVVLKEFPVLGRSSMEAAAVSIAVNMIAPDLYGEFHEKLMTRDGEANEAAALEVAEALGLSREEIRTEIRSDAVRETVEASYEVAQALGLSGTPSYVVGDIVEFGAVGYDALKESINETRCGELVC